MSQVLYLDTPEVRERGVVAPSPAYLVAGALAHLARHMETGCQRSAHVAAMLLEKVANDPDADDHLRRHARELVEILERDEGAALAPKAEIALRAEDVSVARLSGFFMGTF